MGQIDDGIDDRYADDVIAYRQAAARADAAARVADERFECAVEAARDAGCSVREIAQMTDRSKSAVARVAGHAHRSAALRSARGLSYQEYREAHDAAWRHHPPAQMDGDAPPAGWDGVD